MVVSVGIIVGSSQVQVVGKGLQVSVIGSSPQCQEVDKLWRYVTAVVEV